MLNLTINNLRYIAKKKRIIDGCKVISTKELEDQKSKPTPIKHYSIN